MAERVPIWYELSNAAGRSATDDASFLKLAQIAARLKAEIGAAGVAVASFVPGSDEIRCMASCGTGAPPVGTLLDVHSGLSGKCIRENRTFFSNNAALDERVSAGACERLGVRSFACIPLRQRDRCIGVLAVFSDRAGRFNSSIMERVEREAARISELVGPAIPSRAKLAIIGNTATQSAASQVSDDSRSKLPRDNSIPLHVAEPAAGRKQPGASRRDDALHLQAAHLAGSVREGAWKRTALIAVSILLLVVITGALATKLQRRRSVTRRDSATQSTPQAERTVAIPVSELTASAQSGSLAAQAELAHRYANGNGVEQDRVKASVWYIIAGANGDGQAKASAVALSHSLLAAEIAQIRFNIGKIYVEGTAVPRDLVAAYSWFSLAQAAGDVRAANEQEKLEAMMSPQQVSEGLARARDWMMAHPSKHWANHPAKRRAAPMAIANAAPGP